MWRRRNGGGIYRSGEGEEVGELRLCRRGGEGFEGGVRRLGMMCRFKMIGWYGCCVFCRGFVLYGVFGVLQCDLVWQMGFGVGCFVFGVWVRL